MALSFRAFSDAKIGNDPIENEDAVWPTGPESADGVHYAVSDGATESSYSRQWAEILVRAYGEGDANPESLARVLPSLRARWRESIPPGPRPWYAEQKLEQGAFASLLGVKVSGSTKGLFLHCLAIGDSCLAVVRRDALALAWPFTDPDQFGLSPTLLSSSPLTVVTPPFLRRRVRLEPGDSVLLMTDAVASWFLSAHRADERPWRQLDQFEDGEQEAFAAWSRGRRATGTMRNDDVTVGVITFS